MAGTTNLLQWNPTGANQENDAAYLADSQRAGGATDPSLFDAALANKLFYQVTTYLDGLFSAFAAKGFTTSDSNLSTLTAQCANFLTTADVLPAVVVTAYAASVTLNAAAADGFYVTAMTGNLTIAAINGLTSGQLVALYYQQDGVGGRVVTFPSVMVGAVQPDPTANSVSLQLFGYDVTTAQLRAITPLTSNTGTFFGGAAIVPGLLAVGGLANLSALQVASAAPLGALLVGDGSTYVTRRLNIATYASGGGKLFNTAYQNTTDAVMDITVSSIETGGSGTSGTNNILIGPNNPPTQIVAAASIVSNGFTPACFCSGKVPPGWWFTVTNDTLTLAVWTEYTWI